MKLLFLAIFSLLSFNNPEAIEKSNCVEISALATDFTTPYYDYPTSPEDGDYERMCRVVCYNPNYDYAAQFSLEFRYYNQQQWQTITVVVAPASNGYCGSKRQVFSRFIYLNHKNCTYEYVNSQYGGYY